MKRFLSLIVSALCAVCAWAQGTMTGADLAAMMGSAVYEGDLMGGIQKVYAREDGNIYQQWGLQAESVIVEASEQVTLYGSTYECPAHFTFHIEDGKVSKVSIWGFDLIPSLGDFTEAEFAEFVGGDVYSGTDGVTIIAKNGAIYMVDGEGTETALHDKFDKFERVGKDFKFSKDGDINTVIIFHPLGDKFVVYYQEDYVNKLEHIYVVSADEAELVAAMGDREYVKPGDSWAMLHVENDKVCLVSTAPEGTKSETLNERYMLTKKDNNTFVFFYGSTEYDFHITDGKVTTVTYMVDDEVRALYQMPLTAPIAQIGETIYTDVDAFITAFEEIEGNATVQLLGDIILPDYDFLCNKDEDANITLDLNGHNITGNRYENAVIITSGYLTISGEGVVENTGEYGDVVGCEGYVDIYGGTYIGKADICYCFFEGAMFINGGKFNAPKLYYDSDDRLYAPTVYGGLFSMDPTDCLAVGYDVVENDDVETKDVYPFMVVESDVDLTNPAGLLAVPQAGELNVRAYFTTMPGMPYMYALLRGEYHSLKEAKENSKEEDFVCDTPIPQNATAPFQSINIKDSSIELEDDEVYTLVVFSENILDIEDEPIMELAVIAFQVGEGEIAPESILVEAGKLNTSASFSVSDEDLEAGAAYSCLLFEGRITNFVQAMIMTELLHALLPVYVSQVPVAIESNDVEVTLSSDEVELVAGKEYTLVIYDSMRQIPEIGIPLFYDFILYKAVEKNTETAIERVNADKAQKAVKTIENGKVVIIRGDKKYDLSGREL